MAKSKADLRTRFNAQIAALCNNGETVVLGAQNTSLVRNFVPDPGDWNGQLTDLESIAEAFSRQEHAEDVSAAIADGRDLGVVGDLITSSQQGDYLAVLERAFRFRHTTQIRRLLQAAARRRGHSDPRGLFQRGVIGLVAGILRKSKDTFTQE